MYIYIICIRTVHIGAVIRLQTDSDLSYFQEKGIYLTSLQYLMSRDEAAKFTSRFRFSQKMRNQKVLVAREVSAQGRWKTNKNSQPKSHQPKTHPKTNQTTHTTPNKQNPTTTKHEQAKPNSKGVYIQIATDGVLCAVFLSLHLDPTNLWWVQFKVLLAALVTKPLRGRCFDDGVSNDYLFKSVYLQYSIS